jgi:hypothetical protein
MGTELVRSTFRRRSGVTEAPRLEDIYSGTSLRLQCSIDAQPGSRSLDGGDIATSAMRARLRLSGVYALTTASADGGYEE